MSVEEQNKNLVRRHLELLSAGDAKGAAETWAQEGLNHGRKIDRETLTKGLESLITLNERHTIHEMIAEGEWVAVRTTCTGTYTEKPTIPMNSGIFSLIGPTGQTYTFQHIHLFKVSNGKIVEHWANRDDLGAARQIGLELKPADTKS